MKFNRWCSAVVLSSLILTGALGVQAGAPSPAVGSDQSLDQVINAFVLDFDQWQAQQKNQAQPEGQSYRDKMDKAIERIFAPNSMDRRALGLSSRIANTPNGDTGLQKLLARMKFVGRETGRKNPQAYHEIVATLVADYYIHPERRDAIYFLLSSVSGAVEPQLHRGILDPAMENAIRGWGIALTGLVVVDAARHGGWDAMKSAWAGKGALPVWAKAQANRAGEIYGSMKNGAGGLLQRMRGNKSTKKVQDSVPAVESTALGAYDHASNEKALQLLADETERGAKTPAWSAILGQLGFSWNKVKEAMKAAPRVGQALGQQAMRQAWQHSGQIMKAIVLGGLPGYAWGVSETPKLSKMDPMEILRPYQALAILDAHLQILRLSDQMDRDLADAYLEGPMGTIPDKHELRRNRAKYQKLIQAWKETGFVAKDGTFVPGIATQKKVMDHFSHAAKEFTGNHPSPEITRKVRELQVKNQRLRFWAASEDERIAAFTAQSNALSQLAKKIESQAAAEARKKGIIEGETRLHLSLDLVQMRQEAVSQKLEALEAMLKLI